MASETGRISVSLPHNKQVSLETIAQNMDRSRNWIVNQAIDQYLDLYEWQTEKIKSRLKHAQSGDANVFPSQDVNNIIEGFSS
jgi:predicted transcriptional regulator